MSYSASEIHIGGTALLAAAGVGAYVFPLIVPWHILLFAVSAVTGIVLFQTRTRRLVWAALCAVVFVAVLKGYLPSPLAAAAVSASALTIMAAPATGAAIMVMNLSLIMTMQEIVADTMHSAGLEAAGPTLTALAVLLLSQLRSVLYTVGAGALSILAAWVTDYTMVSPEAAMTVAALPACGLAALIAEPAKFKA